MSDFLDEQSPHSIVEDFYKKNAFFYDRTDLFWLWNTKECFWEIKDETDVLNSLSESCFFSAIKPSVKAVILNALKQYGRKQMPLDTPKTILQFKNKIFDITKHQLYWDADRQEWGIFSRDDNFNSKLSQDEMEAKLIATPDLFITNPLPYELSLDGFGDETPKIDRLFTEWVGEKNKKKLYQLFAYCMLPDYPIERIFCLVGSGANGKSECLRLLRRFIGDKNVTTSNFDALISDRFEPAKLHKKLACMMGETNFNELSNTQLLKRLVSGKDQISMQYKFKGSFDYVNYAKIIISTNTLPPTTDKTYAFYRRWMIIDFPNQFDCKTDLSFRVSDEEIARLNRKCLKYLIELLKTKEFDNEGDCKARELMYESKSNPIETYWKENIVEDYESTIPKWKFKEEVDSWLKARGHRQRIDKEILTFMKDHNVSERQILERQEDGKETRYRHWVGIHFKEKESPKEIVADWGQTQGTQHTHPSISKYRSEYIGEGMEGCVACESCAEVKNLGFTNKNVVTNQERTGNNSIPITNLPVYPVLPVKNLFDNYSIGIKIRETIFSIMKTNPIVTTTQLLQLIKNSSNFLPDLIEFFEKNPEFVSKVIEALLREGYIYEARHGEYGLVER